MLKVELAAGDVRKTFLSLGVPVSLELCDSLARFTF